MQGIILAAGMGKRLKNITKNKTKCMVEVNGISLIERMLKILDRKDLSRIVIVTGYQEETLKEYIASLTIHTPIIFVENPIYDKTNNIYSLSLTATFLEEEDTLLLESDLIFDETVIDLILCDPRENLALVDRFESWMDGTCMLLDENDCIVDMVAKKNLHFVNADQYYKTVNIYKFSRHFSKYTYVPFLKAYAMAMGNNEDKNIYLTFDLGYEGGYTAKILDDLKDRNIKATFFITAHYLNTAQDLVKRMIDEGHTVGNHTVNHKSMPDLSDEEIKTELMKLNQALYEKFGYEMKYMRPPKGEFSERTLSITDSLGFKTVMWSFAYVDWNDDKQPSKEEAMKKIISNLHNGEIMLLHATSKTNSEIMGEMVDKIKEEGYEIKSLEEFR